MATAAAARTVGTQKIGEAQELFSQQARMRREQLEGHFSPFTVINFNPVGLRLEGLLKRYHVPTPDDSRLPKDVARISIEYRGKERIGHALTIREPLIYGKMSDAKLAGGPGEVVPTQQVAEMLPAAIAYSFLEHYSPIFVTRGDGMAANPPNNARRMCGVLAFEGDLRALEGGTLERNGRTIQVPLARTLTVGKTSQRIYETVSASFDDYLAKMFDGQKRYADLIITRAQTKFTEGKGREEIGAAERTWYRWAIRMGYVAAPKDPDRTWLNEMISLSSAEGESPADVMLRKCPGCRTVESEPDSPFCQKCNRPMDVFRTFMSGHPVPEAYLATLEGDEREQALAEYRRRQLRMADFGMPAPAAIPQVPESRTQRGAGGRFARSGEGITPATSTKAPGEE